MVSKSVGKNRSVLCGYHYGRYIIVPAERFSEKSRKPTRVDQADLSHSSCTERDGVLPDKLS